uniref:Uncharacterized protein n=1 Tax=Chromera velia CCMP2878 TaxID=1169474 RepID=A0A0G4I741_9ALVE|eukprot:Cvel_11572.t1-p1 / transcript=Cvel_11572.t1 / gene=Cvel_11572 / organism=Chromera_velia_CCMP2878 / gene_product=hypothetical protein / transcript_product=hypothetical protein / location=Cvel_scaffold731:44577-51538(-) / protein_length=540 / sequence_SO=supercontig / SO=protein_coding / is_pseudo=false
MSDALGADGGSLGEADEGERGAPPSPSDNGHRPTSPLSEGDKGEVPEKRKGVVTIIADSPKNTGMIPRRAKPNPTLERLVGEELEKSRFVLDAVVDRRDVFLTVNSDPKSQKKDQDLYLTYKLLPLLNRGLAALHVHLDRAVKDPSVLLEENGGNGNNEETPTPRLEMEQPIESMDPDQLAAKIAEEADAPHNKPFNPLTWLAQYLMRNHPEKCTPEKPLEAKRDRIFFSELKHFVENEKGIREGLRRSLFGDLREPFEAAQRRCPEGRLTVAALPLFVDCLDSHWNLRGELRNAIPASEYSRAIGDGVGGAAERLEVERGSGVEREELAEALRERSGRNAAMTLEDTKLWWENMLRRSEFEMIPYERLREALEEKEKGIANVRSVRKESFEERRRLAEEAAIVAEQQASRVAFAEACNAAVEDPQLQKVLAGERRLGGSGDETQPGALPSVSGEGVRVLRVLLSLRGFPPNLPAEGDDEELWNDRDFEAVLGFQEAHGLQRTGVVDGDLLKRLMDAVRFERELQAFAKRAAELMLTAPE